LSTAFLPGPAAPGRRRGSLSRWSTFWRALTPLLVNF